MDIDWLRRYCLGLPHTTEHLQWEVDLVFKIGGKIYAVAPLEPAPVCISFKAEEEEFAELVERPGVIPAPYLARAKWVALTSSEALARAELERLLRRSYELVLAKLPQKAQAAIAAGPAQKSGQAAQRSRPRRKSPLTRKSPRR